MNPIRVLLIEDNPDDAYLARRSIQKVCAASIIHAPDGPTALAHLDLAAQSGEFPDIVLMDLRLPGMDGLDVLQHIAGDSRKKGIFVIALTSSESPRDRSACEALGVRWFLNKPLTPDKVQQLLDAAGR